jgi:hypothetical protein
LPRLRFSAFRVGTVFLLMAILLLLGALLGKVGQTAGFFGAGTLLLVAFLCFESAWLKAKTSSLIRGKGWWPVARMGFRNTTHRPGRSIL